MLPGYLYLDIIATPQTHSGSHLFLMPDPLADLAFLAMIPVSSHSL